ncbi:sulfonate transport system permease protein [Raoultella sp. BIGb0149]|uniref:ABC transporter permease n=1 Tax=Raoultella TaxID=160674 RepID=UPI0010607ED2|nr:MULTISPECIES: ABC transporter permease [Raoultella]MCI1030897.1 ABC transporter permease [Raoultella terrigena]TDQ24775.1 sulfonate transport system permease protein [Raoultella sp. BIGb0149]
MRSIVIPQAIKASAQPQRRAASGRYSWLFNSLLALVFPAFILLLWQVASDFAWMPEQILPAPSFTLQTAVELMHSGELGEALRISLLRLAGGFVVGSTLGLALGLLFATTRAADEYIGPTVRAICLVPSLGWLPFFMLIFGIGETLKFVLIAKTCFLPVLISSYNAARDLPQKYRDVARVLELSGSERLRIIYFPAIAPAIFTGLRLSLSKGWKALILVEMIASAAGIGYLMTWGRKAFQLDVVFVTMVFIGLIGWLIDYLASRWEKRLMRWADEGAS